MWLVNVLKEQVPETQLEGLLIHASQQLQKERALRLNLQYPVLRDEEIVWVSAKEFFGE